MNGSRVFQPVPAIRGFLFANPEDSRRVIYLDHNATTPVDPRVLEAMLPFLRDQWGNPSSPYAPGHRARQAVEDARARVASLIGACPEEILFTSGGTESISAAIRSAVALQPGKSKVLVSAIEHSASWKSAHAAVGQTHVLVLPVSPDGCYDADVLATLLDQHGKDIALASLMWANNETGGLPGLEAAAAALAGHGIPVHTDAVQAVGKIPVDAHAAKVDFLSLSGHKFHGPKGIGALFIRGGRRFQPLLRGGGQESSRRAGTENVPGIAGLGAAATLAAETLATPAATAATRNNRDRLESLLFAAIPGAIRVGGAGHRLPNTSCLHLPGIPAADLVLLLDAAGLCCSSGSACSSASPEPSRTLLAHGLSRDQALQSLRLSLSHQTTAGEIDRAAKLILRAHARLHSLPGGQVARHA